MIFLISLKYLFVLIFEKDIKSIQSLYSLLFNISSILNNFSLSLIFLKSFDHFVSNEENDFSILSSKLFVS